MRIRRSASNPSVKSRSAENALWRSFPAPRLLTPHFSGIDISDRSVKWIVLDESKKGFKVLNYGFESLPAGVVSEGLIRDEMALAQALQDVKLKLGGIACVNAALPEEAAYVFSMHVPEISDRGQILNMIEFELEGRVPVSADAAVYDYDIILEHDNDIGTEIGVVVFPREVAESYADAFSSAGFELQSLEVEARSIARAVSTDSADETITLSVDFGRDRTGFAVLKRGIPIFTSTVKIGGEAMSRTVMEKLALTEPDTELFKNDEGLQAEGGIKNPGVEALIGTASALADEVAKLYHYWDTRRNDKGVRVTPVSRVYLLGGNSNLKGLADFIAERVQAPTERPNVWKNVCAFDDYIPPIDRRTSLQYATAIGLALRGI